VAPVGGAVVDAETYRLTRHAFGYRTLDAVDAKGKRDPVQAWLVERSLVAPAERPTSTTPLVGRDREVLLIRTIWDRAVTAGSPHLVTVLGPAGIGKSRLAQEVAAEIEVGGGRVLRGRSLPYEEQTPYRAFGQMLRRAGGIYENGGVEVARRKLAMLAGSLFVEDEAADASMRSQPRWLPSVPADMRGPRRWQGSWKPRGRPLQLERSRVTQRGAGSRVCAP
jgi:hypothetical protein